MEIQHIDEFKRLFQEFKATFVDTTQGQEHIGFYERDRQQGTANFRAVEAAFQQQDIASYEQMTDALTEQVLRTLLPHSDTATHRNGGYWIHRAPAIQGDIKEWYGAGGVERDWQAIAHAIYHFFQSCIEYPSDKQLQKICKNFSELSYTKGFQSGFLTPILNAVNPDEFLLINSKPKKTINYFSGSKISTQIGDYPAVRKVSREFIDRIHPVMRSIDNSPLSDADQFDMFCHWLVSIKKLNFRSSNIRYWKITPENYFRNENEDEIQDEDWVCQWDEWKSQGFISLGSYVGSLLGDVSGMTRSDFEAKRDEVLKECPDGGAELERIWNFSSLKSGDRVVVNTVANQELSKIFGVGTVTGPCYYNPNAEIDHYQLPVRWDDTAARNIHQPHFNWNTRFLELNKEEFDAIVKAPKIGQSSPTPTPPVGNQLMSVNPDCPFNLTTFDLLAKLHQTPKKTVYDAHKQDFKIHLEEPFQRLMLEVADQLPDPIKEAMEMRHRIFSRILKNDYGQGGAHEHYWGAFYPKGSKRTEGAQLILIAGCDRLTFGFDIGHYSNQQRERFLTNCQKHSESLVELLEPSLDHPHLRFGDRGNIAFDNDDIPYDPNQLTFKQWLKGVDSVGVHVFTTFSKANALSYSGDALRDEICKVFSQLFPLVLLATLDEPISSLQEYLDSIDPDDNVVVPVNESYTLTQCAAETYLDEQLLRKWVDAIKRKRQAILYGPPGTGKTFVAQHLTRYLLSGSDGCSSLVQFHPAYTYEDFIQGIRPKPSKNGGLEYPVEPGRFLKFCEQARTCQGQCVLIIDEINRANLAQVFGELMYLLEYRDHDVELASGQTFSIPSNVRIIGTMNTADRSIALIDHALRRRFAFLPLYPDMNILRGYHQGTGFAVEGLVKVLRQVNDAIGDRHYQLGTSFFLRTQLATELPAIWQMEIEPYLEEYFFDRIDQVDKFRWDRVKGQILP